MNKSLSLFKAALPVLLVTLMACEPVPDSDSDGYIDDSNGDVPLLPEGNFANPEGLAVTEDFVIVANSRYRFEEHQIVYDPSFATVIDRNTNEVVNRIPLRAKNAQRVAINGDMAWVLCSGSTSFDGTKVAPTDDGALLGIPIANLAKAKAPEIIIPIPLSTIYPLVGYPSSLAFAGDTVWLGSGTSPALFKVDLATQTLLHGPDNPVFLGDVDDDISQDTVMVIEAPNNRLIATSFNRDTVWILDATTGEPIEGKSFSVGLAGTMNGILAAVWRENGPPYLYLLMGMSSSVTAVNPDLAQIYNKFIKDVGMMPNAMILDNQDRLLILNSGDNNVKAYAANSGQLLDFKATMPQSTNPFGMAISDDNQLYVTGLLSNSVFVFDASPGINPGDTWREIR